MLRLIKIKLLSKIKIESEYVECIKIDEKVINEFIQTFTYELTNAQNRALKEIFKDLKSPYRMNRLLQGDVGSGKTVIAALALYAVFSAGKQGALMVPTEILAEQHFTSLKRM